MRIAKSLKIHAGFEAEACGLFESFEGFRNFGEPHEADASVEPCRGGLRAEVAGTLEKGEGGFRAARVFELG